MSDHYKLQLKIFLAIVSTGFAVFALYLFFARPALPARAEVIFLNVGQGDAILIQEKQMQILVDGGNGRDILNRLGEVMPFADKQIDLVVLTHPDEDHMGGLIKVLENYEVRAVLEPGIACDKDLCQKWDELVAGKRIRDLDVSLGLDIAYGKDIDVRVLYPVTDLAGQTLKDTNEASVVLKAIVGGKKFLLTGDTEDKVEKELVAGGLDLRADVLKVSHHGSKYSTSAAFLREVAPNEAVISVGKNSYGHPAEETLTRLRNMNIRIDRTDESGNLRF